MTPLPEFPAAEHIGTAIVMAARVTGEDTEPCLKPCDGVRCRHVAYDALRRAFPNADHKPLAACLGYRQPNPAANVAAAAKAVWWSEIAVDEIVGAIVGEERLRA